MKKCKNHPDRSATFHCQKQNSYLCEECMHCLDSELYCKFRTSCVIHFTEKEDKRASAKEVGNV